MTTISRMAGSFRQMVARRRSRRDPYALVLLYHRIAEVQDDPWDLAVSPQNFAAHLKFLHDFSPCLGFTEALDALTSGAPPRSAVCVTFDDGYRDNVAVALPLLEAVDVPATIFVTSGAVGSARGFWWDRLVRSWLSAKDLPPHLSIGIGRHRYDLPSGHRGSTQRWRGFDSLRAALLPLQNDRIHHHLDEIASWAAQDPAWPPKDQPMNEDELGRLAASPLIEIGGHTVTHAPLTMVNPETAAREITDGRRALAEMTGQKIASFAYPYGRHDAHTVRLVAEAGFRHAATVVSGVATASTAPFRVPRLQVRNWTVEVLESRLRAHVGQTATRSATARTKQ